jgi:hypothetical protein
MADIDPLEQLIVETRAFVDARPVPDFANAVMREVEHLEIDRATTPRSWIVRIGQQPLDSTGSDVRLSTRIHVVRGSAVLLLTAVVPNPWFSAASTMATRASR